MGRLGNPSSRGYATPTYSTTQITARETFGGPAKAGLGRHIGMGPWTFGAIVNGSSGRSGHAAPPFAGMNFHAAYAAGALSMPIYPIGRANQLSRVGVGTTGGMTRTPADGVNKDNRDNMQARVDRWNPYWPARPIRDTPNNCCYVDPVGKRMLGECCFFSFMFVGGDIPFPVSSNVFNIQKWYSYHDIEKNFEGLDESQKSQMAAKAQELVEEAEEAEADNQDVWSDPTASSDESNAKDISIFAPYCWRAKENYKSGVKPEIEDYAADFSTGYFGLLPGTVIYLIYVAPMQTSINEVMAGIMNEYSILGR